MTDTITPAGIALRIEGLRFAYKKTDILRGVNLSADYGEFISLLGRNGAGKTTLFRCLLKFLTRYSGGIFVDGVDIKHLRAREIAKRIAYIPQTHTPVFNYDVLTVVLMGTNATMSSLSSPGEKHIAAARAALESLGISKLADCGYAEISGGERQLVLIARALVQRAKIFIMDEPTANLDYGNQITVLTKISELSKQGYLVLLSTHNPEHAIRYSARVLVLKDGVIDSDGSPQTVLTPECIEKIYGIKLASGALPTQVAS